MCVWWKMSMAVFLLLVCVASVHTSNKNDSHDTFGVTCSTSDVQGDDECECGHVREARGVSHSELRGYAEDEPRVMASSCSSRASSPYLSSPPRASESVHQLLMENYTALDTDADRMVAALRAMPGFMSFSHARSIFKDHLLGTWGTLVAWGQPQAVCRAGLFHTAYSGDLFQFFMWDAADDASRAELRTIVGEKAERLVYLFGTMHRGAAMGLSEVISGTREHPHPLVGGAQGRVEVPHRLLDRIEVSNEELAAIMMVTLADYMDQMVEVNAWRDHHQVSAPPTLYPGDMRPAICLYWLSSMCHGIREHAAVVPPIFDNCTRTILRTDEIEARDRYWSVVVGEATGSMPESAQLENLLSALELNPFVGEPHVLAAEIFFRKRGCESAVHHAATALEKFYSLATAWDKRLDFNAWVAYARMLLLRAQRCTEGRHELPSAGTQHNALGMPLVSINELVEDMLPHLRGNANERQT